MKRTKPESYFDLWFHDKATWFGPHEIRALGASHHDPESPAHGLNTLPPQELWTNIVPTLAQADALREFYGAPLRILSAYRSPEYNQALEGTAKQSLHMRFMALDLCPAGAGEASAAVKRLHGCARILHRPHGPLDGGLGLYRWGVHIDCGPFRDW